MSDMRIDPRKPVDVHVNSPGREGLTGTAPANLYAPSSDREQITIAPDWRPSAEQPAWRQDFPIDWSQDQYVERRDFMRFLVLISGAFTAGQFWIGAENWWRTRRGLLPMRRVASLDELPVGSALVFSYPNEEDANVLVRLTADAVVAFSQKCTHLSCAVIPRPEQGVLFCPCHEAIFDLQSGRPLAGPPRLPLPRVVLEIRGRDIYATGVESSAS